MSALPRLGDWRPLAGPSGARLAVAADLIAAAGLDRLSVWSGGQLLLTTTAGTPAPGWPRFIRDRKGRPSQLCWGTTVIDLAELTVRSLDPLAAALTPEPVPRVPGHAVESAQLTDLAWSDDGSTVLLSCQTSGPSQSLSASATLYRSNGERVAELWHGPELAPVAGLLRSDWAVVGCPQAVVYALDGRRLAVLAGTTPPRRIDTDAAASGVLTVEAPMLRLWDSSDWGLVAAAEGPWADACLGPDADWVLAVGYDGQLQVLDTALRPVERWSVPGPPDGIAVGDRLVAAAIGGTVWCAPLSHR
ncbi:MAG: hypothetical protein ABWX96_03080 [Propionibacteriaceae bacterium]